MPVQSLQTQPALSQINVQLLLNHLQSSGSTMSYDSLLTQNRSEHENQNLLTTSTHQNILSGRPGLWPSETFAETSGFGSAVVNVPIAQKDQKESPERSRDGDGKFRALVEYPLSVKRGAKQWRKSYLDGLITNPDGKIGSPKS